MLAGLAAFAPAVASAADPGVAASSTAPETNSLPDLGTPAKTGSANVQPGPNGVTAHGRFDGTKISITPEYSDKTGVSLGVALASMLGEHAAVGVLLTGGADKKEVLVNAGFKLDERQRFIVTVGQLKQFLDYAFVSGTEKAGMTQNSGGVSYQLQLGKEFLRYLEVNGYVSKTASRDLADKTFAVDTATLYELWNDPRRIAGGKVEGLQGKLGFSPISGSTVKVSLGFERLSYDLLAGSDSVNRPTAGLEWLQQVGNGYQVKLAAETFAAQNRYTFGVDRSLADGGGRHSIGLNLIGLRGRDGLGNDQQLQLIYSYVFGAGATAHLARAFPANANPAGRLAGQAPLPSDAAAPSFGGSLLDQVALRPSYILGQVVAKVDKTALPTRLIAIDKTALPAATTINTATGDVTVPLGVAVTGIAGVTRNAAPFANGSQFALSGNSLIVRPSQIVQPAVGITDTYVVTINNQGGGTTLVTVTVSHGSVKIDSIVVTAGAGADSTAPSTPATLTLTGNGGASAGFTNTLNLGLTVADVTDPSGVSWFVSESASAPVVGDAGWSSTKPTSYTLSAGEGAKTVYVYVKDNVGNVQATGKSAAITLDQTLPTVTSLPSWAGGVASGLTTAKSVTFGDTAGGSPQAISITADNGASITGFTGAYGTQGFNLVAPANNTAAAINVTITYSVTDNAGNSVALTTQTVSVAPAIPATPTGLNYNSITGVLSWNAVLGAVSYNIDDIEIGGSIYTGAGTSFGAGGAGASPGETLSLTAINASGTSAAVTIVVPP